MKDLYSENYKTLKKVPEDWKTLQTDPVWRLVPMGVERI
jgi:hypothetical protein